VREEVRERAEDVRRELREQRDRLRARVEELLGEIEQAIPEAEFTDPAVRARGQTDGATIDAFLTRILTSVDRYWTRTFAANDLPEPRVRFSWVPPGGRALTACRVVADDSAAFYCPGDDTIYIAQRFAADLYDGVLRGLPGQEAGVGRAAGDFGVAYVVAHEYAHNLQHELDLFTIRPSRSAKPFELQADCMAGAWGNSVYREGLLAEGDVEEAMETALAVGDFDVDAEQHHGTPEERRSAWVAGFETGDPSVCSRYVPR
jgi:predicted metalloprotease